MATLKSSIGKTRGKSTATASASPPKKAAPAKKAASAAKREIPASVLAKTLCELTLGDLVLVGLLKNENSKHQPLETTDDSLVLAVSPRFTDAELKRIAKMIRDMP